MQQITEGGPSPSVFTSSTYYIGGGYKNETKNEIFVTATENSKSKLIPIGIYTFQNSRFGFLSNRLCYWTNSSYDGSRAFAFERVNDTISKIYPKAKNDECRVIPVIIAPKTNLLLT